MTERMGRVGKRAAAAALALSLLFAQPVTLQAAQPAAVQAAAEQAAQPAAVQAAAEQTAQLAAAKAAAEQAAQLAAIQAAAEQAAQLAAAQAAAEQAAQLAAIQAAEQAAQIAAAQAAAEQAAQLAAAQAAAEQAAQLAAAQAAAEQAAQIAAAQAAAEQAAQIAAAQAAAEQAARAAAVPAWERGDLSAADRLAAARQAIAAQTMSKEQFAAILNSVLARAAKPGMTRAQMLLASYQYILGSTSYLRTYETPGGNWTKAYALDVYYTGRGNCYRYAAAFGYLAVALGYEVKLCTGQIQSSRGGLTPHGWAEIWLGDDWYIFDPDMQDAKGTDFYAKTYANYPVKPLVKELEWPLTI